MLTTDKSKTARSAADAARLRALNEGLRPLVLPNVWDATSAAIVAATGAAGINQEDSAGPGGPLHAPALQAEQIGAARAVSRVRSGRPHTLGIIFHDSP
jgi:2-methylisocitrate lyase-like PEP mutase family enzyme